MSDNNEKSALRPDIIYNELDREIINEIRSLDELDAINENVASGSADTAFTQVQDDENSGLAQMSEDAEAAVLADFIFSDKEQGQQSVNADSVLQDTDVIIDEAIDVETGNDLLASKGVSATDQSSQFFNSVVTGQTAADVSISSLEMSLNTAKTGTKNTTNNPVETAPEEVIQQQLDEQVQIVDEQLASNNDNADSLLTSVVNRGPFIHSSEPAEVANISRNGLPEDKTSDAFEAETHSHPFRAGSYLF